MKICKSETVRSFFTWEDCCLGEPWTGSVLTAFKKTAVAVYFLNLLHKKRKTTRRKVKNPHVTSAHQDTSHGPQNVSKDESWMLQDLCNISIWAGGKRKQGRI